MSEHGFRKLERKIKRALSGDMLKNALDFVAYIKANEMTLDIVTTVFSYLGKEVCCLTLDGNSHPAGPWSIYWMTFDIYEQDENGRASKTIRFGSYSFLLNGPLR